MCFPSQLAGLIWFFTSLGDSSIKCFDAWHALIAGQNIKRSQLLQFYQWKGLWEIKICFSVSNLKNITAVVLIGERDSFEKKAFFLSCIVHLLSLSLFFSLQKIFKMPWMEEILNWWPYQQCLCWHIWPQFGFLLFNILNYACSNTVPLWEFLSSAVCLGITGIKALGGSKSPSFMEFWCQDTLGCSGTQFILVIVAQSFLIIEIHTLQKDFFPPGTCIRMWY